MLESIKYTHTISAIPYIIKNPSLMLTATEGLSRYYFARSLSKMSGRDFFEDMQYFLPNDLTEHLAKYHFVDNGIRLNMYSLIKKYKPEIVIETGVGDGASSAFTLAAMHENKKGHLYSIDLPPYECFTSKGTDKDGQMVYIIGDGSDHHFTENKVGKFIPEYVKDRWTLIAGDAKVELPKLLEKLGDISIFFHDSLHTYDHMLFEYEAAWPHITEGGLLLSHDVLWNNAFSSFCRMKQRKPVIYRSLGIIKK
ncbi:MAG TPA: class I SAM-dependent methyltransferase [Methanocella sp.]|uniref:class I SAM-dependent methyltransferase n=1 Tax=Methanocella sp. TaxID=2052833 RepID=UPI002BA26248|nr:class I SAM-dependent methyltransferase [Methanocella sp.]HTY91883.1 class I SAM-dependent methyltransferase [Methanocella sp.]